MTTFNIDQLAIHHWPSLVVRGIIAILFGIAALVWPGITVLALIYLFGAFALLEGIITINSAFTSRQDLEHWWLLLIEGLAGILIAILTFFSPLATAIVLLYLIAAWAIIIGVTEIVQAIRMRAFEGEWMLILSGVLSVILGIILFFQPINGLISIVWLIGIYALIFGAIMLIRAYRYRTRGRVQGI